MPNSDNNLIIADLHLHSKYSRAVSQSMDLAEISLWATRKGIRLVGTADWTHPLWFRQLSTELVEKEPGLFALKSPPPDVDPHLRFVLTVEVSNIYSQNGRTRRIHTVLFSPSLATIKKVQHELSGRGVNLTSDGRPIMGLSMIELAELLWSIDPDIFILPAHIWTPWFSLYGSASGFDSLEECFGRYADRITAVETGLSSDPSMNWSVPELDKRVIVSFSDAHSGPKLGREATVFKRKYPGRHVTYHDLTGALKKESRANLQVAFTIEFFPEEGKYHLSGHRNCQVRLEPAEVDKLRGVCPKCHKKLTIRVLDRVRHLSPNLLPESDLPKVTSKSGALLLYPPQKDRPPFVSIIPLLEVVADIEKTSPQSKKAQEKYDRLIRTVGTEFEILLFTDLSKLAGIGEESLAQALEKMRSRKVRLDAGYDGVFGKITVDAADTEIPGAEQKTLF